MCGLLAVVNEGLPKMDLEGFVKQGLLTNTLRGEDSTGIFSVNNKGEALYYKKAIPGWDFVQLKAANTIINTADARFMVGHNRATTRGSATNYDHVHPVKCGDILLVHNGTLTSLTELNRDLAYKDSSYHDSTAIAMSISRRGAVPTLELLEGAYALIWYNLREHTLNIARNSERTLYMAQDKSNRGWLLASEGGMLKWLANRNRIETKHFAELKEGLLITVPLDKTKPTIRQKFKVLSKPTVVWGGSQFNHSQYHSGQQSFYKPTKTGTIFRAVYTGKYQLSGGTGWMWKFKRPDDTGYAWICNEEDALKTEDLGVPRTGPVTDTFFLVKALEDRSSSTDHSNKLCIPVPGTPENNAAAAPAREEDPLHWFREDQSVKFMVVETNSINRTHTNIKGITEDTNNVEVRAYNLPEKFISSNTLYEGTVSRKVAGSGVNKEPYLVLHSHSIKEVLTSTQRCGWCNCTLNRKEIALNTAPELGNNVTLCDICAKTYERQAC